MKYLATLSALYGLTAAHAIVKELVIDGTKYPGYDPRYDLSWNQKRIEWGYSSKSSANGIGPAQNMTSKDMACRFAPVQPPALMAEARAGSSIKYQWSAYYNSHKGPVITYMGKLNSPTQDPTTVDFFKIHENAYDTTTHLFGSDILYKNNMSWTVPIPSNLKAGNYIVRSELVSLHYATLPQGPEFYISCLNLKLTGDGTAFPDAKDTVRFPGAYKADDPYLAFDLYNHENKYISPGPQVWAAAKHDPPKGSPPVVKATGVETETAAYNAIKALGLAAHEGVVKSDDKLNPGGGGCIWEPGQDKSTAVCTPVNAGHDMKSSLTNGRGQFDVKKPKQAKTQKRFAA